MTPEEERRVERVAKAKVELRAAMQRMPFDFAAAGAVRVQAWKKACVDARKVLETATLDASRYDEARRAILACGGNDVDALAKQLYGRSK